MPVPTQVCFCSSLWKSRAGQQSSEANSLRHFFMKQAGDGMEDPVAWRHFIITLGV